MILLLLLGILPNPHIVEVPVDVVEVNVNPNVHQCIFWKDGHVVHWALRHHCTINGNVVYYRDGYGRDLRITGKHLRYTVTGNDPEIDDRQFVPSSDRGGFNAYLTGSYSYGENHVRDPIRVHRGDQRRPLETPP